MSLPSSAPAALEVARLVERVLELEDAADILREELVARCEDYDRRLEKWRATCADLKRHLVWKGQALVRLGEGETNAEHYERRLLEGGSQ